MDGTRTGALALNNCHFPAGLTDNRGRDPVCKKDKGTEKKRKKKKETDTKTTNA